MDYDTSSDHAHCSAYKIRFLALNSSGYVGHVPVYCLTRLSERKLCPQTWNATGNLLTNDHIYFCQVKV